MNLDTYVDELVVVTLFQIVQNSTFVKIGQIGHIFNFFEFWRIDLTNVLFLNISSLNSWKWKFVDLF